MPAYPNITRNLVNQVQAKSGCLLGLNTKDPKNSDSPNASAGSVGRTRSSRTIANSSESIRASAAGATNRVTSEATTLAIREPARIASGIPMPTSPEAKPRRSGGTWSGRVALTAASAALNRHDLAAARKSPRPTP